MKAGGIGEYKYFSFKFNATTGTGINRIEEENKAKI